MRITTAATLALTILLATTALGAVAATPSASSSPVERSSSASSPLSPALEQSADISSTSTASPPLERPNTWQVIEIRVTDNGNARWTVESRFLVTNDTDEETFNEYAAAVTSGKEPAPYDRQMFARFVARASESTGREMSVENAGWDEPRIERIENESSGATTEGDSRVGVISYSFTWTNFATVDGDRIHVGDALSTSEGPLIRVLSDGQRLIIAPPNNYGFVDAPTGTENGALVWDGPHRFDTDGLEITILRGAGPQPFSGWSLLIGVFLVLTVLVGAGSYLLARRGITIDRSLPVDRLPSLGLREALGLSEQFGNRTNASDDRRRTTAEGDGDSETGPSATVESAPPAETETGTRLEFEESTDDGIDPELLSDEERVLRLLKRNGGRMKQASIVSETGWSNAKVSQLLSKMDENDEIEKLRIGRENLITLPGVDPTAVD
ncbi:helix-turn-helix transcriptional regulator [Natrinema sp. 74]|uniref:helix-turn-helix transcriptional regulator n=1 Tax=Natrinema sp. 74 TaxID=3384159 RepID=UPI0038D4FF7F